MSFIEIEAQDREQKWSMSDLQNHNYYEIYFLLKGTRQFFLDDNVFSITAPTVCVIPPFRRHKTGGGAYRRININVSADYLISSEKQFLDEMGKSVIYKFDVQNSQEFLDLLETAASKSIKFADKQIKISFMHVLLCYLQQNSLIPLYEPSQILSPKKTSEILKVIDYISEHYAEQISIDALCKRFFISRNSLCMKFRALMHCSIKQYHNFIKISKAKELLITTKKSMEEVAELCGFSSGNFFSLVFKKETGLSPLNYRKNK